MKLVFIYSLYGHFTIVEIITTRHGRGGEAIAIHHPIKFGLFSNKYNGDRDGESRVKINLLILPFIYFVLDIRPSLIY